MSRQAPTPLREDGPWRETLRRELQVLNIELPSGALEQCADYARLLQKWGPKLNLSSRLEPDEILCLHIIDSLSVLAVRSPSERASLLDIGTGAGLPGIPLKIARPDLRLTLVDTSLRKTIFCREAIGLLRLNEVTVVRGLAREALTGDKAKVKPSFDWCVSRAAGAAEQIFAQAAPLVKQNGTLALYKGPNEGEKMRSAINRVGEWRFDDWAAIPIPRRKTPRGIFFFVRLP